MANMRDGMAGFGGSARGVNGNNGAGNPEGVESAYQGGGGGQLHDRSIGDIIADLKNLSSQQVETVLAYQRQHRLRFGEAAVALGFASDDDVLYALSQQFHYPYAP